MQRNYVDTAIMRPRSLYVKYVIASFMCAQHLVVSTSVVVRQGGVMISQGIDISTRTKQRNK